MANHTEVTDPVGGGDASGRSASLRSRLQASFLWRVWERMLEVEFVDRSIALAAKAFVSFFPLVIVVAAFVPARIRLSIVTALQSRLGMRGDALTIMREAFASSDDVRQATGVLGLVLAILFASSFTTALRARLRPRVATSRSRSVRVLARSSSGCWRCSAPWRSWGASTAGCTGGSRPDRSCWLRSS